MANLKYEPKKLRQTILRMARNGDSNHLGCAFSVVEIISAIYENFLPPENKFVLSKGHGVMALYAALVEKEVLPPELIEKYFCDGSEYAGLAESHVPGIEACAGSLGHGICVAAGMALARKRRGNMGPVFCLVGDGEMNEGSCWEALLLAGHQKLKNFVVIVDKNSWQAMGRTDDILNLGKLEDKFTAFGFEALACEGHDLNKINHCLKTLTESKQDSPKALVCHTVKGYGVSYMQDDNRWHYMRMDAELYAKALAELEQ